MQVYVLGVIQHESFSVTGCVTYHAPCACSCHQNLYPGIEEIGFNSLQPVADSVLHISTLQIAWQKGASCMKQAVTSWLQALNTDFFYTVTQALLPFWCKCLNVSGDYMEVWCVPSAAYAPCTHQSHNTYFGNRVFLTLFIKLSLMSNQSLLICSNESRLHSCALSSFSCLPSNL